MLKSILFLINERYVESVRPAKNSFNSTFFINFKEVWNNETFILFLGEQKFLAKCQWIIGLFFTT